MSHISRLFISILLLTFIAFNTNAQQASIEKKGEWGSGEYRNTAKINDLYFVKTGGGNIDVLDPSKVGKEMLVHKLSISNNNWDTMLVDEYQGYLVVIMNSNIRFYDVTNIFEPIQVYGISVNTTYSNKAISKHDGKFYYASDDNKLFVINNDNNELTLENVLPLPLTDVGTDHIQDLRLYIIDNQAFITFQSYRHSLSGGWQSYLELFDTNTGEKLASHTLNEYQVDAELIGETYLAISNHYNTTLFKVVDDTFIATDTISMSQAKLTHNDENLWAFSDGNSVTSYGLSSSGKFIEQYTKTFANITNGYNNINSFKIFNDKLVFTTSLMGLIEFDTSEPSSSLTYLYNQSSSKGVGLFINDNTYLLPIMYGGSMLLDVTDFSSIDKTNDLTIGGGDFITHNEMILGLNNQGMGFYEIDEYGDYTELSYSDANIDFNTYISSEDHLFTLNHGFPTKLSRYDINSLFAIYESPTEIEITPAHNEGGDCPDKIVKHKSNILVLDRCYGSFLHIFSDINSNNIVLANTVTDTNYLETIAANDDYLVLLNSNEFKLVEINDANELAEKQTVAFDSYYGSIQDAKILDNTLFVLHNNAISVYDLTASQPSLSFNYSQLDNEFDSSQLSFYKDNIIVTKKWLGQVSFFGINKAPLLTTSIISVDEDQTLFLNDYIEDPDDDSFEIEMITSPTFGQLTIEEQAIYTPDENFAGQDSFDVIVRDAKGNERTLNIIVDVLPVNDLPTSDITELETSEDTAITITLDVTDADGESISFRITNTPLIGNAAINDKGELTYTPHPDLSGSDSIILELRDSNGTTAVHSIDVIISAVNDLPIVSIEEITTQEEVAVTSTITATDIDSEHITFAIVGGSGVNGSATINSSGEFTFVPVENANGSGSFKVSVSDGIDELIVIIDITIEPVNDAPSAIDSQATTTEGNSLSGNLTAQDVDGDSLTYTLVSDVINGTLELSTDGSYTYTPNAGFSGTDSFTYEVSDGELSGQAQVSFTITAKPVAPEPTKSSSGGGNFSYWLLMFLLLTNVMRSYKTVR